MGGAVDEPLSLSFFQVTRESPRGEALIDLEHHREDHTRKRQAWPAYAVRGRPSMEYFLIVEWHQYFEGCGS